MLAKRVLVLLAVLLLAAGSGHSHAQTQPLGTPAGRTTFVIVHGAWGGGWAWKQVDSLLTARGHEVYRPTLTGLGERAHLAGPDIDLSTHIQDVVNVLRFEQLDDVVLVGHSYGGMVITGVADRVPARIRQLVYLDALLPESGESLVTAMGGNASGMVRSARDGLIVPAWVKPDATPPTDVPHPAATLTEPLSLSSEQARRLPAAYILTMDPGATEDNFSKFAARARQRGWPTLQMEADHNPQWSKPRELVDLLLRVVH